jgi:hypothetical protein
MANKDVAFAEMYSGNFVVTKIYLGGGPGVPGSGSWAADYYVGPYKDWKEILVKGTMPIRRILITDEELNIKYTRLGYIG